MWMIKVCKGHTRGGMDGDWCDPGLNDDGLKRLANEVLATTYDDELLEKVVCEYGAHVQPLKKDGTPNMRRKPVYKVVRTVTFPMREIILFK